MAKAIGAGTVIMMGDGAAPMNAANGGAALDADLDVISGFTAFNLGTSDGTVDITDLSIGAAEEWARKFIAGLSTHTIDGTYMDDPQGTLFRRMNAIKNGTAHVGGRGKVDVVLLIGGAVSGNMKWSFTILFTARPFNIGIDTPLGGSFSAQCDGKITVSTQA